jgi:hypothetical protein
VNAATMATATLNSRPGLPYDTDAMSQLKLACLVLPVDQYATVLNLFPGNNAHPPWGTHGSFFFSAMLYVQGHPAGRLHSPCVSERGNIRVNFDELTELLPAPAQSLGVVELNHARNIPIEVYLSHIHRQTGVYVAYPAMAFVGDQLYPTVHTQQLENTLFWPGLMTTEHTESCVAVLNPYEVTMGFQVHLLRGDGQRNQSQLLRLKPFETAMLAVEELFPGTTESGANEEKTSVCVAAQYKLIAYMVLRDRATGIITTIDHLHTYCLY